MATKKKSIKKGKKEEGQQDDRITFRCPEDLYRFIEKYAAREGRTISNAVVYMLRRFESEAGQIKMF